MMELTPKQLYIHVDGCPYHSQDCQPPVLTAGVSFSHPNGGTMSDYPMNNRSAVQAAETNAWNRLDESLVNVSRTEF
jgi:hypothetical protein